MGLFDWLRKKREDRLPYKIIDVTFDELSSYVGHGYYVVLCSQEEKARVIELLLESRDAKPVDIGCALRDDNVIIIWGHLISCLRLQTAKHSGDFHVWLRPVEPKISVSVDDLI